MKRFDPTEAAQISERHRIAGTRPPDWVIWWLCLWSFYSNRHREGMRKSRSKKARGGYVATTRTETHRMARRMVRSYVRELRAVGEGQ